MPARITALINTRNEELNLPDCLASVAWADEVVVADMASADRTREIASAAGARVMDMPVSQGAFEWARNLAATHCTGDWILVVDADERVQPALARRLRELADSAPEDVGAYGLPRKNYFLGVWLEHGFWPDHQIRFHRRGRLQWKEYLHEWPEVEGRIERLPAEGEAALEHPGYGPSLPAFTEKLARYASLDARRLAATLQPDVWPFLFRRPMSEFFGRYLKDGAWRYGMTGLVWSLLQAAYQLQVVIHYWEQTRGGGKTDPAPETLRGGVKREILREALKWPWR
jgi:glycosyltransferase involved in cell wall biosynthesis